MKHWKTIATSILITALFGYGGYRYYLLNENLKETDALFEATVADFENRVSELEDEGEVLKRENNDLVIELIDQVKKNESITGELKDLSNIVSDFEKLKKIDPELLEKYSKIYFLNENYVPLELVDVSPQYVVPADKQTQIHAKVWPFLEKLLQAAATENAPVQIVSGYRSFGDQSSLKSSYRVIYGAGTANQFSADQGYSEHQLGTAVDFTTPDIGLAYAKFGSALAYTWLTTHAHKYGFILSYPKGNEYYIFEPWHWRFVGVALATKLHDEGKSFYDLDQRTIDEYLIKIFDEQ